MKAEKIPVILGGILIVLLAFLIVWQADILGVSAGRLEEDARENQNISSSWKSVKAINEDICAMLFYDDDTDTCTYSIYLSREGMSYGYFFRQGGFDSYIAESAKAVVFEDKGIALLSLNRDGVCRVVTDNGVSKETIRVDPDEPFAIVLPIDRCEITMYDTSENVVTVYDAFTGA